MSSSPRPLEEVASSPGPDERKMMFWINCTTIGTPTTSRKICQCFNFLSSFMIMKQCENRSKPITSAMDHLCHMLRYLQLKSYSFYVNYICVYWLQYKDTAVTDEIEGAKVSTNGIKSLLRFVGLVNIPNGRKENENVQTLPPTVSLHDLLFSVYQTYSWPALERNWESGHKRAI